MNNKFKRLLAVLFSLSMVFCLMSANAWASPPVIVDPGYSMDYNGNWTITSKEGLKAFRDEVNSGNTFAGKMVTLANDIDLENQPWTPIGTDTTPFSGTFDGNNRTIKNLKVDNSALVNAGLFGYTRDSTIQNLEINNAYVNAKSQAGALAGNAFRGTVSRCNVDGVIHIEGHWMVGGLIGSSYAMLEGCNVVGTTRRAQVISTYEGPDLEGDATGGLVGFCGEGDNITTADCFVMNAEVSGTREVGGLAGSVYTSGQFTVCRVNEVKVITTADKDYATANNTKMGVGGLVGCFRPDTAQGTFADNSVRDVELVVVEDGTETHRYSRDGYNLVGWATTTDVVADETYYTGSFKVPGEWADNVDMDAKTLYGRWTVNAPAAPDVDSVSSNAITVKAVEGVEYSINPELKEWKSGNEAKFTGLNPGTEYTIYARKALTGDALMGVVWQDTSTTTITTPTTGGGTTGGGSTTPTTNPVTVPVSGEGDNAATANMTVQITGSTATITSAEVDKVLEAEQVGSVTFDMSTLNENVEEVVIPAALVEKVAAAAAEKTNDTSGLEIKLSTGTVTFDADALATITAQAGGQDVKLHLDSVPQATLTEKQQETVKDMTDAKVVDVYLTSNGNSISSFGTGTATLSVPYKLKDGQSAEGVVAFYIAEDGTKTEVPCDYDSKDAIANVGVPHFSNYVIAYDAAKAQKAADDAKTAADTAKTLDTLPAASDVKLEDKEAIEKARAAYDALTDAQKAKGDPAALKKLTDAEAALKALEPTPEPEPTPATLKTQKLTLSLKDKGKNISAKKLAKKAQKTTIKVKGAKTKLTFKSSNKKIATVSKKGVVTFKKGVKKGVKKGKKVKITVTAKATNQYKAAKKTITIKVKK